MLDELLDAWATHKPAASPPVGPIRLWTDQTRVVYIEDKWGPAVPYPAAATRKDGSRNYGYVRLKASPEGIGGIPEVQGWPELQRFLEIVNAPLSPIESLGCEKGFFPIEGEDTMVKLGSYVDVVFSEPSLVGEPANLLRLAAVLMNSVVGCEQWWGSVVLGLRRLRP